MGRFALSTYSPKNSLVISQKLYVSQKILLSALKIGSAALLILLFLLIQPLFIPSAYATTTILPEDECAPENIVAYMYRPINTHGAISASSNYDYVLCYEPLPQSNAQKTLSYTDATTKNVCWGGNEVFSLTSARNAHFALPRFKDGTLYNNWCYGYLSCYGSPNLLDHEQVIGKLQDTKNTHFTLANSSDPRFGYQVVCHEPVCDAITYANKIPFPYLYTFDSDLWMYESFGTNNRNVVEQNIRTPPNRLADNALFVAPNVTIQPRINKWVYYDGLQFYVFAPGLTESNKFSYKFEIKVTGVGGVTTFNLADYSEKPLVGGQWIRVRIPFKSWSGTGTSAALFNLNNDIEYIRFTAPTSGMFVDSLSFISPVISGGNMFQNFYCGREEPNLNDFNYFWVSDVDANTNLSQNACNNIDGYGATGTRCCGDDLYEIYNDTLRGCFYSRTIPNASVFSFVSEKGVCIGNECTQNRRCVNGVCPESVTLGTFIESLDNQNKSSAADSLARSEPTDLLVSQFIAKSTTPKYSHLAAQSAYFDSFTYAYNNGAFYSCGVGSTPIPNYLQTDDSGQIVSGLQTFQPLGMCQAVGDFICTPQGFSNRVDNVQPMIIDKNNQNDWYTIQSAKERNTSKPDPVTGISNAACCPQNSCFYNDVCYADMLPIANAEPVIINGREQLCQAGAWTGAVPKISLDGLSAGYCGDATQCLVNPAGIPGSLTNPKCINNQQKFDYAYCDQGNWTSTTNLLAQRMVKFAEDNTITQYTLFCDDLATSLNYLGVVTGTNSQGQLRAEELLRGLRLIDATQNDMQCNGRDCVNNFCVLTNAIDGNFGANSVLVVGTTTNFEVTNNTKGLGAVFDLRTCSETSTSLTSCTGTANGTSEWFYEGSTKVAIYKQGNINPITAALTNIGRWFRNLFGSQPQVQLTGVFAESKFFDRVYIAKTPKVNAYAFTESVFNFTTRQETQLVYVQYNFTGNYQNAQATTCAIVQDISAKMSQRTNRVNNLACHINPAVPNVLIINATSSVATPSIDIPSIWTPLTSELRFT
jgi:hypothetical protein